MVSPCYWSRSRESDATVRADYALTTTTTLGVRLNICGLGLGLGLANIVLLTQAASGNQSCPWVGLTHGLGWVRLGWVGSTIAKVLKI